MSLYDLSHFSAFVIGQPGGALVEQWDSHVAQVGTKVFALLGGNEQAICFKVEELSFDGLCALEGVKQAPYFAKRQWVRVHRDAALPEDQVEVYLSRSYQLVAAKLTKKVQAELGISAVSAD
jgi:predicted DNA-binding protein (MmcQ/YjbR family)